MYCKQCGNEINNNSEFCEKCGSKAEQEKIKEVSNEDTKIVTKAINNSEIKQKKSNKWALIAIFVLVVSLCAYLFTGNSTVDLGEAIEIKDIIKVSFNEGNFFEEGAYPSNATDKSNAIQYDDGKMFALYGMVQNLSLEKYDLNKVVKVKFIFDNKYETDAMVWLENSAGTEFEGLDTEDLVWLDPNAIINPKSKRKCTVVGNIGEEIYSDADDVKVEIQILKSLEGSDYYTYTMPLVIE